MTRLNQPKAQDWYTRFCPGDEVAVTNDAGRNIPPGTRGVVENVMAARHVNHPYAVKVFFDNVFTWEGFLASPAAPRGLEALQTVPPFVVLYFSPEALTLVRAGVAVPFRPHMEYK